MKIKVWLKTDNVGSTCIDEFEIENSEWEQMTPEERESMAKDAAFNMMEWGFKEEK
jgi:hypothetical protein